MASCLRSDRNQKYMSKGVLLDVQMSIFILCYLMHNFLFHVSQTKQYKLTSGFSQVSPGKNLICLHVFSFSKWRSRMLAMREKCCEVCKRVKSRNRSLLGIIIVLCSGLRHYLDLKQLLKQSSFLQVRPRSSLPCSQIFSFLLGPQPEYIWLTPIAWLALSPFLPLLKNRIKFAWILSLGFWNLGQSFYPFWCQTGLLKVLQRS